MKEKNIDLEKWESICLSSPTKDGREYYIWSSDFGMFKKRDAEIISDFLGKNVYKIIEELNTWN